MTNVVGIIICTVLITLFILGIVLMFDKIVTSFEKLEKSEKESHDIIITKTYLCSVILSK